MRSTFISASREHFISIQADSRKHERDLGYQEKFSLGEDGVRRLNVIGDVDPVVMLKKTDEGKRNFIVSFRRTASAWAPRLTSRMNAPKFCPRQMRAPAEKGCPASRKLRMEVRHGEDVSHLEYEGVRFVDVVALVEPPLGVEGQGVLAPQIGATLQVEKRVGNLYRYLQ